MNYNEAFQLRNKLAEAMTKDGQANLHRLHLAVNMTALLVDDTEGTQYCVICYDILRDDWQVWIIDEDDIE